MNSKLFNKIFSIIKKNYYILLECYNTGKYLVTVEYLKGKGFNFYYFTHFEDFERIKYHGIYDLMYVLQTDKTKIKIIKNNSFKL
jgi:hypothetical protein